MLLEEQDAAAHARQQQEQRLQKRLQREKEAEEQAEAEREVAKEMKRFTEKEKRRNKLDEQQQALEQAQREDEAKQRDEDERRRMEEAKMRVEADKMREAVRQEAMMEAQRLTRYARDLRGDAERRKREDVERRRRMDEEARRKREDEEMRIMTEAATAQVEVTLTKQGIGKSCSTIITQQPTARQISVISRKKQPEPTNRPSSLHSWRRAQKQESISEMISLVSRVFKALIVLSCCVGIYYLIGAALQAWNAPEPTIALYATHAGGQLQLNPNYKQMPPPAGLPPDTPPIEMTFEMKCLLWVIKPPGPKGASLCIRMPPNQPMPTVHDDLVDVIDIAEQLGFKLTHRERHALDTGTRSAKASALESSAKRTKGTNGVDHYIAGEEIGGKWRFHVPSMPAFLASKLVAEHKCYPI